MTLIIIFVMVIILETSGLIFLLVRGNKTDGRIYVSGSDDSVVWNIQTNNPEKITEANGQIVRFKVVKGSGTRQ